MGTSKDKLVETMSELMWERGYAAVSPREVRERSGVGQGSMYHHFAGKRELAIAALHRNIADLVPSSTAALQGPGDPLERLTSYLRAQRDALKGCRIGRLTQDPMVAADTALIAPIGEAFAEIGQLVAGVIEEAIEAGQLPARLDARRLAATLQSTIQGGYVLAIAAQDPQRSRDACEGALDLLLAAGAATADTSAPVESGAVNRKEPA